MTPLDLSIEYPVGSIVYNIKTRKRYYITLDLRGVPVFRVSSIKEGYVGYRDACVLKDEYTTCNPSIILSKLAKLLKKDKDG